MMNKTPDFSLQQIPTKIFALKNFSKWRYVGNELEVALFNGLLEYHIEVNKVDNFSKLLLSQQNIGYTQKVKTIMKNTENNNKKRMEAFLTEIYTRENYFSSIKEIMKIFFSLKSVKDQQAKEKLLADTFQVIIIINDKNDKSERISLYKNNPKAPSLTFYCLEQKYYFTCSLYKNQNCQLCGSLTRVEQLKCDHFICFDCLSKQFQKPNISSLLCNQCHSRVEKNFYLNLQQPKTLGTKQKEESSNKIEEKQLQNPQIKNNSSNSNILSTQQQSQYKNQFNEQKTNNLENHQKNLEQQEQKMQTENNSKQLFQSQQIEKESKKQVSLIQEKKQEIISEITQKQDVFCNQCKQVLQSNNEVQVKICKNCQEKQQAEKQFLQNSNGKQQLQQNAEYKDQQNRTQDLKIDEQKKCDRCKTRQEQKMFENSCGHKFCIPCLEKIAQRQNLKCYICQKKMKEEMVENFYFQFQQELLEKQETEELKCNEQQAKQLENNQIDVDIKQQKPQNNKQQKASNCSFCQSPFSEYNIQQQLDYCENKNHTLGVCCIIFPLDCPQCQISSLVISKSSLSFSLQHEVYQDLKSKIHQ